MFYNPEFEDKMNRVNEEFDKLFKEHQKKKAGKPTQPSDGVRSKITESPVKNQRLAYQAQMAMAGRSQRIVPQIQNLPTDKDLQASGSGALDEEFRKVIDMVYDPDGKKQKKHKSPTKRLMQQKNASWKHKEFLSKNLHRNDGYSLTYTCDPKKSFVIQPREGEINYAMHEKKPIKFYETVLKQKVMEHKVSQAKTFTGEPGQ